MTTHDSPATDTPTNEAPAADPREGTVTWWEIQVSDLAVAKDFYAAVFGWTFTDFYDGFTICHGADGSMIGGLEQAEGEPAGRGVRVYVQTADLEGVLERVAAAGGTVVSPRAEISEEFGWFAVVADPSGLRIGLCSDRPARPARPTG